MRVIDLALKGGPTFQVMLDRLKENGIEAVISRDQDGRAFGITFVDHVGKCVFKGSDIGKSYSLAAISDRLGDCSKENMAFLKILESSTNLNAKPGIVLGYWQCLGVTICESFAMGYQTFLVGRRGTPLSSYCLATGPIVDFIQKQLHGSRSGSSVLGLSPVTELKGILALMIEPVEEYNAQPGELLREARKKKRKPRHY